MNTGRALAPRVRKIREPQSWPQKNKANTNFRRVGRYLGVLERVAECLRSRAEFRFEGQTLSALS